MCCSIKKAKIRHLNNFISLFFDLIALLLTGMPGSKTLFVFTQSPKVKTLSLNDVRFVS
jgi:hypothetical protein